MSASRGTAVELVQHDNSCRRRCGCLDKTGRWFCTCPECRTLLRGVTEYGLMQKLLAHLETVHFRPKQGNA